jgi:hypothetical protein
MKANKTHISLETAKLLNDCGVGSKYYWYLEHAKNLPDGEWIIRGKEEYFPNQILKDYFYPAYTWQEILWENAEKFFGKEVPKYLECSEKILRLLQQEKYDEADEYFRDKCVKEMPQFKGTWKKLNDLTIIKQHGNNNHPANCFCNSSSNIYNNSNKMKEEQIQKLKEEASQPTVQGQIDDTANSLLDCIEELQDLVIKLNNLK